MFDLTITMLIRVRTKPTISLYRRSHFDANSDATLRSNARASSHAISSTKYTSGVNVCLRLMHTIPCLSLFYFAALSSTLGVHPIDQMHQWCE